MAKKETKPKTEKKKSAPKKEAKAKKKPEAKAEKTETKPDKKIKGIIFDFWGTLVENGVIPSPIRKARFILRLNIPFSDYVVAFEESLMIEKFNDLYEGFAKVCKTFDVEPDRRLLDILVGMWNKNKMFAKPYSETIAVLDELKKEYKIALISNTDCFSLNDVMEKYGLGRYFDAVALSCDLKMLKSNPKMFKHILDKLGFKEDEVIMVGDSIESDIKSAENAGIRAVLVDRRNMREHPNKINDLTQLKDFISKLQ